MGIGTEHAGEAVATAAGKFGTFENLKHADSVRRRVLGPWRFIGLSYVFLFLVAVVVSAALSSQIPSDHGGVQAVGFVICMGIGIWGIVALNRFADGRIQGLWYARGVPRDLTISIAVTDAGLRFASDFSAGVIYWSGLNEISLAGEYWLLYGAGEAYAVPCRFFATPAEERLFVSAVFERLSAAAQARSREAMKMVSSG